MYVFQTCPDMDIKLIATSEKHNCSSKHPTNMIFNFLERLKNYLKLSYYDLKVIQPLINLKHAKQQFYPEHGQNLTCNLKQP